MPDATAGASAELSAGTLFWRLYAAVYDTVWDSPLTAALAGLAEAHTQDASRIVDLGCGTGLMTRGRRADVTGVDLSAAMLGRALRTRRIARAVQNPADATGLPGCTADAVLLSNVLHLHPDPGAVLHEAERLCRPGGTVFACWPLDGIDTADVHRADRSLGRSPAGAALAHTLRGFIGIAAAFTGMGRTAGTSIEQAVLGACGFHVLHDTTLAGCQRVIALRRQTAFVRSRRRASSGPCHVLDDVT